MNFLGRNCKNFQLYGTTVNNILQKNTSYKSSISLDKLYPTSSLKLTTPLKSIAKDKFDGYIPIDQLEITYSRSTGPGGQNVNKVNTKVDVRFKPHTANWLNDDIKSKLIGKFGTKITKEGYLVYRSDLTRFQQLNLADCLEKIRTAVRDCSEEKKEMSIVTAEKIRRRLEASARERLAIKRERSQIKQERQNPNVL